ncbi:MAG: TIGR02757 family protein [Prevotellaceae bacterium]|jgi:uncharacterized protein (TIGR02757 family)|nr:TIGR02757 family protein [Prevotellaceae bacterium]
MRTIRVNDEIELRELSTEHVLPIFTTIDSQREYLREWLPFVDYTKSPADTEQFVNSVMKKAELDGELSAAIFYNEEFAGLIGFKDTDMLNKCTEIGYWLSYNFQHKGIITTCCKKLIDDAFTKLGINRIQIKVAKNNRKSIRIPERLGFTYEGTEREGELLVSGFTDINVYSLVKSDKIVNFQDNYALKPFLDEMAEKYNNICFIENDPISIPHRYVKQQDIEIAGFFAAVLAWGQRKIIIKKCKELMQLMDDSPYDFIVHHTGKDLKQIDSFKHRTFNSIDLLYFIASLKHHYKNNASLESAFIPPGFDGTIEAALNHFRKYFFCLQHDSRTQKHIASPDRKSACKRLNMFLRWMVRNDDNGVDFGIWKQLKSANLICPIDVHVNRVARYFRLIDRKQTDWQTAVQLTNRLKEFDMNDPVKYDFALFGFGVEYKDIDS